jgi:hypothetical protein
MANTMDFTLPPSGDVVTRPSESLVPITMVTTGTGWTSATLSVIDSNGNVVHGPVAGTIGTNSITFPSWNVSDDQTYADGTYTLSVTAMVGECAIPTPATRTITLDSVACGQRIVGPFTWNQTNGSNAFRELTFSVENTCPFAVTFNAVSANWTGVITPQTVIRFTVGSTLVYNSNTGTLPGVAFPVTASTLAAASGVTPSLTTMKIFMLDNFTNNGNQNGTVGKFSSMVLNVTSPEASEEQLVDASPIP